MTAINLLTFQIWIKRLGQSKQKIIFLHRIHDRDLLYFLLKRREATLSPSRKGVPTIIFSFRPSPSLTWVSTASVARCNMLNVNRGVSTFDLRASAFSIFSNLSAKALILIQI